MSSMDGSTATVASLEHPGVVTRPLVVPYYWRELMGNLKVGETVYYIEDDAHDGMIIARADGNWDQTIRGTLTVEQAVTFNATLSVQSDITAQSNVTVQGSITASGTITGGTVSLQLHTHLSSAPGTPTGTPV